jgi:branched-chain amino acid transport system substrate-binding protein
MSSRASRTSKSLSIWSKSAPAGRRPRAPSSSFTCTLAAAKAKSLDAMAMAKALQGFELPPGIRLSPNPAFFPPTNNQLIATLYVGSAQGSGDEPKDLFEVTSVVNGADVAGTVGGERL